MAQTSTPTISAGESKVEDKKEEDESEVPDDYEKDEKKMYVSISFYLFVLCNYFLS